MAVRYAALKQFILEQSEKQIGLAASPDTGDDLDETIVFAQMNLLQIKVSVNYNQRQNICKAFIPGKWPIGRISGMKLFLL